MVIREIKEFIEKMKNAEKYLLGKGDPNNPYFPSDATIKRINKQKKK